MCSPLSDVSVGLSQWPEGGKPEVEVVITREIIVKLDAVLEGLHRSVS